MSRKQWLENSHNQFKPRNIIFYIGLISLLVSSNTSFLNPNTAHSKQLDLSTNRTDPNIITNSNLQGLNPNEVPNQMWPQLFPNIDATETIGDTHRNNSSSTNPDGTGLNIAPDTIPNTENSTNTQNNTRLAEVLAQTQRALSEAIISESAKPLEIHTDMNDFTRGGIVFANRAEENKEYNERTGFSFSFIVDPEQQDSYTEWVTSGFGADARYRNNPHNYSWPQQYDANHVIFDKADARNLTTWIQTEFQFYKHNVSVSTHPAFDEAGDISHYITSFFAHSGYDTSHGNVALAFESFRNFIQDGSAEDGSDLVTDKEVIETRMQALLGNRIMFTQNGKAQEFEIVGVTSYDKPDELNIDNFVDKLIEITEDEDYNYYFQNLKNPKYGDVVVATTCYWGVSGTHLDTQIGRYMFLLMPVSSTQGKVKFNLPQAPAEEYVLEAKSGVGAGLDGGVITETDAESGSSTQSSSATEVEIIDLTETIDYKPIPVTNQEYANFIINANMAIDERFGSNMSNFEEFTLSSLDKVEEEFEVQVFKNALSSESAKMIVRFFNKNQDGSELSNTQVDDLLQSIPILYGESIDNYLKLRGGSWGTTPMSIGEDGTPSFNSLAFGEAPLKKKFIDKNLILEELLQMYQYREVLKIYKAGQMLGLKREVEIEVIDNNGVKHNVINSYEYKTSEFGLDLFHYELVNGNTRAFLELIQQKYKIENNISGNVYDFVFIKNGEKMIFRVDPNNPDVAVNEAFKFMLDNVVPIIGEKANGEKYTAEDFLIAESLAAINQKFFEKTGSSIFEIVGISRYNKTIVAPSYDFDISNTGLNNDSEGSEVAKNSKNIKNDKNIKVQNVGFTARNYKPNISELQELTEEARMPKPKTSREILASIVEEVFIGL